MVSSTAWLFLSNSRLVFSRKLLTVRYFVMKRTRQGGVLFWEGILRRGREEDWAKVQKHLSFQMKRV